MLRTVALFAAFLLSGPAFAAPITLKAADGTTLAADHTGTGDRGVVLVHGKSGTRADWASLIKRLDGVQVVAVDLRGYGGSKGEPDGPASVADVSAAVAFLHARGVKKVSVVGAGLGGNLALAATITDPTIESVVMLSPALTADGVKASAALATLGQRPVLLVAGADDTLSLKAANLLAENAPTAKVQVAEAGGSGIALLHRASELEASLVAWIRGAYAVAAGDLSPQTRVDEKPADLTTTGTRLGEKKP